jgi:hypothetical protein
MTHDKPCLFLFSPLVHELVNMVDKGFYVSLMRAALWRFGEVAWA